MLAFSIDNIILVFAILLIAAVMLTKFSARFGLPSLVLFILVGMVMNRYVYYDNVPLTQMVGILALIFILFEGGMQTKWSNVRSVIVPSSILATVGVVLTSLLIGLSASYILGLSLLEGMLFGAIVGSTDAAAVFAVLGGKNIRTRLKSTLEAESGSNDPMAIFLTVMFIQLIQQPESSIWMMILNFIWQMGIGLIMGILCGRISVRVINAINLDSSGLYPVFATALAIMTYSTTTLIGASGMLAVYVAGIVFGNSDLTYRHSIFRFQEGFAWLMHILMFMLLGLLSFPQELKGIAWQGLALSVLLMFVARPIAVFLTLIFVKYSIKEKILISWAGLRGAVPVVLATFPLMAGVENGGIIFNVVFFVVITSALFQGATISYVAEKLGLTEKEKISAPHSLELVSIGKTNSEIIEMVMEEGSEGIGKTIQQLALPSEVLITAIIRQDKIVTPRGSVKLEENDILYVLVPKTEREHVKEAVLGTT